MNDAINSIRSALKNRCPELLARTNVVATGIGYKVINGKLTDTPCIICSVENKVATASLSARDLVPAEIDGVPTDVIKLGKIRAFQDPKGLFQPAPGGISVGHKDITAGTLGCWVKRNGQWVMLSNNHVLANTNDASISDAILQPGPLDGGVNPDDQIATLENFVPLQLNEAPSDCGTAGSIVSVLNSIAKSMDSKTRIKAVRIQAEDNLVDAAIAKPLRQEDVNPEILNIGAIQGIAEAELGMAVKKNGRTTNFTEGTVQQIDVTINVDYGAGRSVQFTDQVVTTPMSQPGDSGSAILDNQNRLVGLLFAGSDESTIFNKIEHVFAALDLTL